ncbi:MAG: hypothetical protein R2771_03420 [Saprospiraceae bacterium]
MFAQSPVYSNGLTFKKLFLDYSSQQGGSISAFKDYKHGFEFGVSHAFTKIYLFMFLENSELSKIR